MYISRGYDRSAEKADVAPEERAAIEAFAGGSEPEPAGPSTLDYHLMHDRLTALERLARLRESGILNAEEFAAEKARILHLPASELVLRNGISVPRGPSLLGRIFNWKLLVLAGFLGLCLSAFVQPQETREAAERLIETITRR